jgi:hypothetical protein
MKVVTVPGGTQYQGHYADAAANGLPAYGSLDKPDLEKLAAEANRRAEALGIKTRYEVVDG